MEDLISIVIPVYNVEKYLKRCLQSVINQTYRNIEIILVDDGSNDKCPSMCDEYAKLDTRIKVIHKENGGLSDARNVGIKNSNGKYITFIDSDDTISEDYVEFLYALIVENNVKIAVATCKIISNDKVIDDLSINYKNEKMSTKRALQRMMIDDGFTVSAWAKMYLTALFNDIEYPKGLIYEDNGTTYKLFMKCDYIMYGAKSIYNYYKQMGTITTTEFSLKKLSYITLADIMCDEINKEYPELKDYTDNKRVESRFSVLRQIYCSNSEKRYNEIVLDIEKYLHQNRKRIYKNKSIKKKYKISFVTLEISKKVFKLLCNLYYKTRY